MNALRRRSNTTKKLRIINQQSNKCNDYNDVTTIIAM